MQDRDAGGLSLVGREAEMQALDDLLDAINEQGAALLIHGEVGIGKSSLLTYARSQARTRGMLTLRVVGAQTEAHLPFAGMHQLVRPILDAIFYLVRSGCAWRYLPCNFPPWQTVFYHFRRFRLTGRWHLLYRALHRAERERVGRHPDPSAAILDSQSVKTVEESAGIRGYDAHKCVKGRKRHLLVDTLGLRLSVYVTPADMHDTQGARRLLAGLKYFVPRLKRIWADAAYRGKDLADWCQQRGRWEPEIVERAPGSRGFSIQQRRWVVERSFA